MPLSDLQPPLPRGSAFPPLQMIYMSKDSSKAKEVRAVLEASWPQRAEVEAHLCAPRPVHPLYFSERIALTANHSRSVQAWHTSPPRAQTVVASEKGGVPAWRGRSAVWETARLHRGLVCALLLAQAALLAAGYLRKDDLHVASHPQRGTWAKVVRDALPKSGPPSSRAGLPQLNLQVTMDGVFQELDVACASLGRIRTHRALPFSNERARFFLGAAALAARYRLAHATPSSHRWHRRVPRGHM